MAAITGAYIAGVLVARLPEAREWVVEGASVMGYGLFVPVFFVTVGLITNVRDVMLAPGLTFAVVVVAVVTKLAGAALGARAGGCDRRQSIWVGSGMIAHGEVALVMATLGLANGLLNDTTFTVVVLMTVVTTLLTPLMLKLTASRDGGLHTVSATPAVISTAIEVEGA